MLSQLPLTLMWKTSHPTSTRSTAWTSAITTTVAMPLPRNLGREMGDTFTRRRMPFSRRTATISEKPISPPNISTRDTTPGTMKST